VQQVHTRSVRPLRVASYVALGAGVAALGAAGAVRLSAQKELDELSQRLDDNGRVPATDRKGQALRNSLVRKSNLLTGLLLGSGAALATGTTLFLLSPAKAPPPLSLGVSAGPDGASATLSGSF
jgi:hypothetical protein